MPLRVRSYLSLFLSSLALAGCCTPAAPSAPPPPSSAASTATLPDTSQTASDRVITERLRTVFGEDFEIASVESEVRIATAQSVVTLTGTVRTERQRRVMAAHARATEGVTTVDDQIVLAPAAPDRTTP
jgi:hypothetical protein